MKASMDQNKMVILVAENEQDTYELGRLAEKTHQVAVKFGNQEYRLEISISDLLRAALGK